MLSSCRFSRKRTDQPKQSKYPPSSAWWKATDEAAAASRSAARAELQAAGATAEEAAYLVDVYEQGLAANDQGAYWLAVYVKGMAAHQAADLLARRKSSPVFYSPENADRGGRHDKSRKFKPKSKRTKSRKFKPK